MKIGLLVLVLFSSVCSASYQAPTPQEITEAEQTFKFKGQWISPTIVKAFLNFWSDGQPPMVTSVDIATCTGSNRFFGEIETNKDGSNPRVKVEDGTVSYQWIGKTKNGQHVLKVQESGDGSMVAMNLMVFKLSRKTAVNADGLSYPQLSMEIVRDVPLGDRAFPQITIKENMVNVKVEFNDPKRNKLLSIQL